MYVGVFDINCYVQDAQKVAKAKTKEGGEKDGSGGTGEGSAA